MAVWTNVSNTVLEPGDPIRSVDIIAIKENVIALSEGSSGAPPIQTAALATGERMNTTNVLNATAGAAAGAVGTYAFMGTAVQTQFTTGNTTSGSNLRFAGVMADRDNSTTSPWTDDAIGNVVKRLSGGAGSGTWRCMGVSNFNSQSIYGGTRRNWGATLWLRIS